MKKRVAGRPKKQPGEVLVDLPFKVDPEALDIVEQIAGQLERPRGWAARKLLMRGIEAYSRDIQTMRPEDAIQMAETIEKIIERIQAAEGRRADRPGAWQEPDQPELIINRRMIATPYIRESATRKGGSRK